MLDHFYSLFQPILYRLYFFQTNSWDPEREISALPFPRPAVIALGVTLQSRLAVCLFPSESLLMMRPRLAEMMGEDIFTKWGNWNATAQRSAAPPELNFGKVLHFNKLALSKSYRKFPSKYVFKNKNHIFLYIHNSILSSFIWDYDTLLKKTNFCKFQP